ncbi:hypothetical protein CO674_25280 [Rhizobium hidalgonense]|uniref:Uncharacterized protein n=1 Tax=Rhizobium hidalgonense TaxID=1538159 RepID=A0ABX4JNH7_9HYPH|nr:hypothetical protein CO674_25280 [Rhizobium hidalgonense]PON07231.1 hypothetical protein ATY29_12955 [Rhizobium hidalgonense]
MSAGFAELSQVGIQFRVKLADGCEPRSLPTGVNPANMEIYRAARRRKLEHLLKEIEKGAPDQGHAPFSC